MARPLRTETYVITKHDMKLIQDIADRLYDMEGTGLKEMALRLE